jgi:hypothetical protein
VTPRIMRTLTTHSTGLLGSPWPPHWRCSESWYSHLLRGYHKGEFLRTWWKWHGDGSKPWYLVNPKIAGKWMFIPLKMVLIGIEPYPHCFTHRKNPILFPLAWILVTGRSRPLSLGWERQPQKNWDWTEVHNGYR